MNDHCDRPRGMRVRPLAGALLLALSIGGVDAASRASAADASRADALRAARHALHRHVRMQPPRATGRAAAPTGNMLIVDSCADDGGAGTLRNVLAGAAEGDTIDLSQLACSTITLTEGPIDTSALGSHQLYDVTLQGPGRDALTIEAAGQSQVFVVGGFSSDKGTFTLNDVTVANGAYDGSLAACIEGFGGTVALNRVTVANCHSTGTYRLIFGGAVDVTTLSMIDSTITGSSATGTGAHSNVSGGGAYVGGDATLVRSVVSGNTVSAPYASYDGYASLGGGLYVRGDLSMTGSTVSNNSIEATLDGQDARGGGIYVHGVASVTASTISGNGADGDGGGLFKSTFSVYGEPPPPYDTRLVLTNATVTGNTAARGGGIVSSRPVQLFSSTIALNTSVAGGAVFFALDGVYESEGTLDMQSSIVAANVVGDAPPFAADLDGDAAVTVSGANNLVLSANAVIALPPDTIAADPLLEPLADNGGPTETLALGEGSPAIDAGNDAAALEFDQRGEGFARVSGVAADIGAFEVQQASDVVFADGFDG